MAYPYQPRTHWDAHPSEEIRSMIGDDSEREPSPDGLGKSLGKSSVYSARWWWGSGLMIFVSRKKSNAANLAIDTSFWRVDENWFRLTHWQPSHTCGDCQWKSGIWNWGNARCHSYLSPPYGLRVPFTTLWDHSNGFEPGFPNTSRVITVFLCSSIHLNYPVYRFRAPMSCRFIDSTLEAFSVCHSHFGVVRIPGVLRDTTGPSPSVPPAAQIRPKGVDIFFYGIHWYPLHGPSSAHGRHGLPWIPMAVAQILAWMYEAHHEPFCSSTGDRCAAPVSLGWKSLQLDYGILMSWSKASIDIHRILEAISSNIK